MAAIHRQVTAIAKEQGWRPPIDLLLLTVAKTRRVQQTVITKEVLETARQNLIIEFN